MSQWQAESLLQAIDSAQIDRIVALAQQYGPEVAKNALVKVNWVCRIC